MRSYFLRPLARRASNPVPRDRFTRHASANGHPRLQRSTKSCGRAHGSAEVRLVTCWSLMTARRTERRSSCEHPGRSHDSPSPQSGLWRGLAHSLRCDARRAGMTASSRSTATASTSPRASRAGGSPGRRRHCLRQPLSSRCLIPAQRPPEERRRINLEVTSWLNECLGMNLTDAFCGFKAYRSAAIEQFDITELRLRHAAAGLGSGRCMRDENRRSSRRADLSRTNRGPSADRWTMPLTVCSIIARVFESAIKRAGLMAPAGCLG